MPPAISATTCSSATGLHSNNPGDADRGASIVGTFLTAVAAAIATKPAVMLPWFADLFWQIPEGREILAGHFPTTVPYAISAGRWIDHEWLFEVAAALAYDHHAYSLLIAGCALLAAAIPVLVFFGLRNSYNPLGAGLAALMSSLVMFRYDAVRPLEFGAFAFALTLFLLRTKRLHPLPAFALAMVWSNVHASVVIAPLVCAFFATGAFQERDHALAKRFGLMTAAMFAGSLCSPTGPVLYAFAFMHLGAGGSMTSYLDEWKPFSFSAPVDWIAIGTLSAAVLAGWRDRTLPAAERLLCIVFFILLFWHGRQIAFVVPAAAAVAAASCAGLRLRMTSSKELTFAAAAFIACVLYSERSIVSASPLAAHHDLATVFDTLEVRGLHGNAYVDYNYAAYSAFRGAPFSVLIDSHAACYPAAVWQDWSRLREVRPGWRDVLSKYHLAVVVIKADTPLAQTFALLPGWSEAARSGDYVAYSPDRKTSLASSSSPNSVAIASTRSRAVPSIVR